MDQKPLFLVFLYLQRPYDTVDHVCILTTLEEYDAGRHMCNLLVVFWEKQEVVIRQNGYHGPHFRETKGTTQGGLISSTLFNLNVKNMVRNWLVLKVEDQLVA